MNLEHDIGNRKEIAFDVCWTVKLYQNNDMKPQDETGELHHPSFELYL